MMLIVLFMELKYFLYSVKMVDLGGSLVWSLILVVGIVFISSVGGVMVVEGLLCLICL